MTFEDWVDLFLAQGLSPRDARFAAAQEAGCTPAEAAAIADGASWQD